MYLKAGWLAGVCLGRLGTFRMEALTVSLESGPYELEPSSRGRAGSALPNLQKLRVLSLTFLMPWTGMSM